MIAIFLFYKTYKYGPFGYSEFEEVKKKKKKKKKGPIEDFFYMLSDTFDFLFGWAMPFILVWLVLGILISVTN